MTAVSYSGVSKRYAGRTVLDQFTLEIAAGESVGLVGESGSGKSTVGRLAAGLLRADSGEVRRRCPAQMIFQNPHAALNPARTLRSSMRLAASDRAAEGLFEEVGLDPALLNRYPRELSGGQKQRVVIARALAAQPQLLVADEPAASLDPITGLQVLDLLAAERQKRGFALLLISHDLRVVNYLCERIVVLRAGVIVEQGSAVEILRQPRHSYTQELVAASHL